MVKMEQSILVFYTTATCNLNCSYCYIDKNPALQEIDNLLDESFKGDYYFNFTKEIFKDPYQLKEVEFWGGEPTLRLDRAYNVVDKLIQHYPNLSEFMMSTNLTHDQWTSQFYGFLDVLGKYPERSFIFKLQLSLDGPTYLNDINRGKGVTEKFSKNFSKIISSIDTILFKYPNIEIQAYFKPTLDSNSIKFLQIKENIIKYYQFFELFKTLSEKVASPNFMLSLSVPNTACPSQHTVEEGKLFAKIVKLCREIEEENKEKHYFKYYNCITPYGYPLIGEAINWANIGGCGTGKYVIGLLPNRMVSGCHGGFVELISDYKKYCLETKDKERTISANNFIAEGMRMHPLVFPVSELEDYCEKIETFYQPQQFQKINSINFIKFLAKNKQVDEKYLDDKEAYKAANYLLNRTSYCIRDNLCMTGSMILPPIGLYKLLLNGALDYVLTETERKKGEVIDEQ